jgi:hypothetical protein
MFELDARRQALELPPFAGQDLPSIGDVSHPVQAYLNALAPSSRRPQLSALDWIARRSTQVFTAESMPWQHLRRPHVLKIRGLLEVHYQPASANRMLSALRGVLRECWHGQLMTTEEYQAAISVPAVRGESERRGRDLSPAELRGSIRRLQPRPARGARTRLGCPPSRRCRLPGPRLRLRSPPLRSGCRGRRRLGPGRRRAAGTTR